MGLFLLIPGLILLLNQATWFSGENAVGQVLVIIGVVLLALQFLLVLIAASKARSMTREFETRFRL